MRFELEQISAHEISSEPNGEGRHRVNRENSILAELARILGPSSDIDEAFGHAGLKIKELIDFDRATFTRLNEADRTIDVKRVSGDGVGQTQRWTRPLEGSITEHLLNTGNALIRREIVKDARFVSDQENIDAGFRSGVAVPIMVQGRLIASLSLLSRRVGTYGDADAVLLERLATQIAPPLEAARLYEEASDQARINQAINTIASILASDLELGQVFDRFTDEVNKLFNFDRIGINVVDETDQTLRIDFISNDDWVPFKRGYSVALDGTMGGEVVKTRRPLIIEEMAKESRFWIAKHAVEAGLHSSVTLPLFSDDRIIATLVMMRSEAYSFTPREIELLERLAAQIAPAVQNSRLFQEVELQAFENARLYQQTIMELEQRQRAEEALKESEARFRQLYDEAPVGYQEVDADGRITRVNRTELEMLGFTADEMLGRRIWEFSDERETSRQAYVDKMAGARPPGQGYERTFIRKDGGTISALIEDRPLFDDQKRIIGMRSAIQDITQRKQTERLLIETARLVSVGELAAGVAHEINNPLTVVGGFSELLLNIDLPQPANRYAQVVYDEVQRMTKVVQNLLSFARRHLPEKRCMNVCDVVERALQLKSYDFKNSGIQVDKDLSQEIPTTLLDEYQLLQVFTNLITNAEQALASKSTTNGRITVRVRCHADQIRISFVDNGPGICKETLSRIFDPFFTTKEVGEGTGLGLSICYGIIQQHGGDLWADSTVGEGTSFHVELPIVGQPDKGAVTTGTEPETMVKTPPRSGKRILVLDDEPGVRELLLDFLSADGHEVETAYDVEHAWTMLQDQEFDLLLLDLRMPGSGGRELYERLNGPDPSKSRPTIFITGDTARPGVQEFLESTGNPVLSKPFRNNELRAAIYQLTQSEKQLGQKLPLTTSPNSDFARTC